MEYTLSYILPLLVINGAITGGIATSFGFLFLFLVLPVVEIITQLLAKNARPREGQADSLIYDYVLYGYVLLQTFAMLTSLYQLAFSHLSLAEQLSLTLSTGCMGVLGIAAAHELVHRVNKSEQQLGLILLAQVTYLHFRVEHVLGHHRNVGTKLDPASARNGENIFFFILKSVFEGYLHSWKLENSMRNTGLSNRVLQYFVIQASVYSGIYYFFGAQALRGFFLQSCVAIALLEAVNYVEHYALTRSVDNKGRVPRQGPEHSWDTYSYFTSVMFFNLGYHADHHISPFKKYQVLEGYDQKNRLPFGYSVMFYLALLPPVWRRVMDRKARKLRGETFVPDESVNG